MKKLINKKTGEIAYIDLYFNTITFSKTKTTHKISIQKDPNTNQITKIISFPEPIINPISEPFPEPKSEPIINNIPSEPSNTSTPNIKSSPISKNSNNNKNYKSNESNNTPILYPSSTTNNIIKQTLHHNKTPNISIHNPNLLPSSTPKYKQSA